MLRVRGGVGRVGKEAGGERGECGRKMGLGSPPPENSPGNQNKTRG